MAQREIDDDPIRQHLYDLLNQKSDIRVRWKHYLPDPNDRSKGKIYRIYRGMQGTLTYTPSIELVSNTNDNKIVAIGTQDESYYFNILCSVENTSPEYSESFLKIFGRSVFEILNDFENRSFRVPGYNFCAYYSEASNIDWGYRRGYGFYSALINWYCTIRKPNRF